MKVTRNTPDQLIVDDTPWIIGILMALFILLFSGAGLAILASGEWAGLLFIVVGGGVGLVCFAVFVVRVQVIFDRPTNALVMRRRSVFSYSEVRHDLSDLQGVVLEQTTGSKGGTLYRPTLVLDRGMSKGRHPIVQAYTNFRGPHLVHDAVKAWLGRADHRHPVDSAAAKD